MTPDDTALCEALDAAAEDWRQLSYPDESEMLDQAARRIRELNAEVEALKALHPLPSGKYEGV